MLDRGRDLLIATVLSVSALLWAYWTMLIKKMFGSYYPLMDRRVMRLCLVTCYPNEHHDGFLEGNPSGCLIF